jgi:hypothetical protein
MKIRLEKEKKIMIRLILLEYQLLTLLDDGMSGSIIKQSLCELSASSSSSSLSSICLVDRYSKFSLFFFQTRKKKRNVEDKIDYFLHTSLCSNVVGSILDEINVYLRIERRRRINK